MKGLITLLLIVFLGWCFGSAYWYVCKIKGLCNDTTTEVIAPPALEETKPQPGNLLFANSSSQPETNNATLLMIDSLIKAKPDTLLIIGKYFSDENGGIELGLTRAARVLEVLKSNGFEGPANLESRLVDGTFGDQKYKAVAFKAIINSEAEEEDSSGFTFTSTDTKIIINFPVASADPHGNIQLINQLKDFASEVSTNSSKVMVSGHTDNTGTVEANIHYGQLRADVIAKMLMEYGVDKGKITTVSKAEKEPIATNDTEEGRKQNRRVEIEIIPN